MTKRGAPWVLEVDDVFKNFNSSPKGLSKNEAEIRLKKNGPNDIEGEKNVPAWRILARQFKSPLVLILFLASGISLVLGERLDTLLIIIMLLLSSLMAFFQEYRSEKSLRLLRKRLTRFASVVRNGKVQSIDARQLVVGDVIELEPGNVISADLRIIESNGLEIDESIITGESVAVPKTINPIKLSRPTPQEQDNIAFMGTHVVQGSGRGLVVSIGEETEMGKTALLLTQKVEETDFQKGVRSFGNFLLKLTIGVIIFVTIIIGVIRGDWIEALLFSLALAVGLSPELLPMIITLNLSRGALNMSRKQVLVKKLMSIEDLGNADVFCTDKTGTLTVGKIRVRDSIDCFGNADQLPLAYASKCLALDLKGQATNPIDQALFEAWTNKLASLIPKTKIVDDIAFDFERRRMSCIMSSPKEDGLFIVVKGAVKEILQVCTKISKDGKTQALNSQARIKIQKMAESYEKNGYRMIAVARAQINKKQKYSAKDEKDLELIGFVLLSDAPKQTARAALAMLKTLNARIIILTGDNEFVTRHVASQLGFHITNVVCGSNIDRMSDAKLKKIVETTNVFAGITPGQKLRIIQALKHGGHVVGFMGDGINDAPALRAADVGISFDSAIDVAKEASDVILLKKSLAVLADGIREGRRTFANIQKYLTISASSTFSDVIMLAIASFFMPFVPLLPAQVLFMNILADMPMLGISNREPEDEDIATPHKWDMNRISKFMIYFGCIGALADLAIFLLMIFVYHAAAPQFRSAWFIENLVAEVFIIFILINRHANRSRPLNWPLIAISALSMIICFATIFTPLRDWLEFGALDLKTTSIILLVCLGFGFVLSLSKRIFYSIFTKQA
ncbi:MAG: magnesium-translocating P-type ATPase [Patescibacteria group bacterium]